jgi:hypothetical protein
MPSVGLNEDVAARLIDKVSEIDKRAPLVRRPLTYRGLTHEAWKRLPCFFRRGEDPPPIKKHSSHKGNRANTAERRPNPTRNLKKLAQNFHAFYSLMSRRE